MEEPGAVLPSHSFGDEHQHPPNLYTPYPQIIPASHLDPSLQNIGPHNGYSPHYAPQYGDPSSSQLAQDGNLYDNAGERSEYPEPPRTHLDSQPPKPPGLYQAPGPQFGVLLPPSQGEEHDSTMLQDGSFHEAGNVQTAGQEAKGKKEGHFPGMKMILNPPNLKEWREKLFSVDEEMVLTEEEFQTYFPHVDNVYSHRSTQRYKRKPFVSHYWDCRLKGRPPGTKKSDDPNKRKRKRNARERDLCDVKIKITEFFEDEAPEFKGDASDGNPTSKDPDASYATAGHVPGNVHGEGSGNGVPAPPRKRRYVIQRVNGNGANGKTDGVPGPHKHTLAESDRIKKNSIDRSMLTKEKIKRKTQKTYHKKATGDALATVKRHAKEHDLKLFGSCFCPFVQRIWIALEVKCMQYQYVEVDPYRKPKLLTDISPAGLVPAMRHGNLGLHESMVILEYLEDLNQNEALLPINDPARRAYSRLWADHVNKKVTPAFYRYLQAQASDKQIEHGNELKTALTQLVEAADQQGPFFLGDRISLVDAVVAPWLLRMRRVLTPYRGWPMPEEGSRLARWVAALEEDPRVRMTVSSDELYLDSYERYAENRPNTSQVADAINSGRHLP